MSRLHCKLTYGTTLSVVLSGASIDTLTLFVPTLNSAGRLRDHLESFITHACLPSFVVHLIVFIDASWIAVICCLLYFFFNYVHL